MTDTEKHDDRAAETLLQAGRIRATQIMPYLSTTLFALQPVKARGLKTFGVDDRWRMYWDPETILTWDVEEVAGVFLHECGHVLRSHAARFKALGDGVGRHKVWNISGDAAINEDLRASGVPLPGKAWFPERIPGGKAGMTTEEFYRLLEDGAVARKPKPPGPPRLRLLPGALRYDHPVPTAVLAQAPTAMFTGPTTVTLILDGQQVPGGTANVVVDADQQTLAFEVAAQLDAGKYTVVADCGGVQIDGTLVVVEPFIRLDPDHLARNYPVPAKIVVHGAYTSFSKTTTVDLLDADGQVVPDGATDVSNPGKDYMKFRVPALPDGMYTVRVTDGSEVCEAPLPIGLPHLTLLPGSLPSGFIAPVNILCEGDDIVFDSNTTVQVLDPATMAPVPGSVSGVSVNGPHAVSFRLTADLPDGPYLIEVTGGADKAVATLTVGGDDGQGDDGDEGQGNGQGEGDGQGEGKGDGQGDGKGQGQGDGDCGDGGLGDCGSGADGVKRDYELPGGEGGISEGRADLVRRSTAVAIREASKNRGVVPAGLTRWADNLLEPKIDWRKQFRSKFRRSIATLMGNRDYTYGRPSRKSGSTKGVVFPAMRQPEPPDVAFVCDTSGSVSDDLAGEILAETRGILKTVGITGRKLHFIPCDAQAHGVQRISKAEQAVLLGGGGTDMRVGINAALALRPKPTIIIVGTDGYTPWPDSQPPGVTVIGLMVGDNPPETPEWVQRVVVDD